MDVQARYVHCAYLYKVEVVSQLSEESDSAICNQRPRCQDGSSKDRLIFKDATPEAHELTDSVGSLIDWQRFQKSFLFVTDSQLLQGLVCGHCKILDDQYRPLLTRVVERIADLLANVWVLPQMWDDPVRWMPREYNKVADGLADLTMDRRS